MVLESSNVTHASEFDMCSFYVDRLWVQFLKLKGANVRGQPHR